MPPSIRDTAAVLTSISQYREFYETELDSFIHPWAFRQAHDDL